MSGSSSASGAWSDADADYILLVKVVPDPRFFIAVPDIMDELAQRTLFAIQHLETGLSVVKRLAAVSDLSFLRGVECDFLIDGRNGGVGALQLDAGRRRR